MDVGSLTLPPVCCHHLFFSWYRIFKVTSCRFVELWWIFALLHPNFSDTFRNQNSSKCLQQLVWNCLVSQWLKSYVRYEAEISSKLIFLRYRQYLKPNGHIIFDFNCLQVEYFRLVKYTPVTMQLWRRR